MFRRLYTMDPHSGHFRSILENNASQRLIQGEGSTVGLAAGVSSLLTGFLPRSRKRCAGHGTGQPSRPPPIHMTVVEAGTSFKILWGLGVRLFLNG
jgi:hypothetical protein